MDLQIDIGTGDGKRVLRGARAEPRRFHIGIDSNADGMREVSRKAVRGDVGNLLFVRAAAEALPEELAGLATSLTILLPWGSLLRAVAGPEAAVLAGVRRLAAPRAALLVVMGYDADRDPTTAETLPPLTRERLVGEVVPAYREAGFAMRAAPVTLADLRDLGTTWASRLAFGRERSFWQLSGRALT